MHADQQLVRIFEAICLEVGTPVAQTALALAKKSDWGGLTSMKVDPAAYTHAYSFYYDYVVVSFLRKYPGFEIPGLDLKRDAREKFLSLERENAVTNFRLYKFVHNTGLTPEDETLFPFISEWRKNVKALLGPIPQRIDGRHGKGSTFADSAARSTVPDKMSSVPTITHHARDFLPFFWETAWGRCVESDYTSPITVKGNRFASVPKDALKERGICIEPSLNVYWQLAIGTYLKERLLHRFKYSLYDAEGRHKELAREGSLSGKFATIDLSDASDRQCTALIQLLVDDDWFLLLNSLRSRFTRLDDKWYSLEKFSSMGNGFTFELMTVLLTSLVQTLCGFRNLPARLGTDLSVYGDDIICHPDVARDLLHILPFFGYRVNERKTFIDGPFRESCGGDYFLGVDVRPHFVKEEINEPTQWISLANGIRRLGRDHLYDDRGYRAFNRAWHCALEPLPSGIRRCRGPEDLGDSVIHDDEERWSTRIGDPHGKKLPDGSREGDGIRFFRGVIPYSRSVSLQKYRPEVVLASALYGVPSSGVTPRGRIAGYHIKWLARS